MALLTFSPWYPQGFQTRCLPFLTLKVTPADCSTSPSVTTALLRGQGVSLSLSVWSSRLRLGNKAFAAACPTSRVGSQ